MLIKIDLVDRVLKGVGIPRASAVLAVEAQQGDSRH
jgi:hypothetical protein